MGEIPSSSLDLIDLLQLLNLEMWSNYLFVGLQMLRNVILP